AARLEALSGRARVRRLLPDDRRALRDEPLERVVEPLPDETLQAFVAARALGAELLEPPVSPDDAAREQHRPADARPLFADDRAESELAGARCGDEPGHAGARDRDRQVRENEGLCSTYSRRTRSGPQTNTAKVFAASTTLSTSKSASSASAAESTSTARWLSS